FPRRTSVPGDRSITHRALMLGALSQGTAHITSPLISADTLRTYDNMRQLGAEVTRQGDDFTVVSKGHAHLKTPSDTIYTGNSGTTTRLITGLLAGLKTITASVEGVATITRRPMDRIVIRLPAVWHDKT